MARILVKVSHALCGGSLGRVTAVVREQGDVVLTRPVFDAGRAELMPDGSAHVMRELVKRHVLEYVKDTRFAFTQDPESGFACEMRVL